MTTFTTEDRVKAQKLVDEAPYHPGYEDAVIIKPTYQEEPLSKQIDELFKYRDRALSTSKKIIEFMKNGQKWDK